MRPDQQIQINSLLLDREELFVRIHDIEQAAAALLGEPYPFTRPVLPSDARSKRKPTAPRAASPGDALRRLEGLETAYRVTYRRFGQIVTEDHDDLDALRTLGWILRRLCFGLLRRACPPSGEAVSPAQLRLRSSPTSRRPTPSPDGPA
jgi:hypothetical protein